MTINLQIGITDVLPKQLCSGCFVTLKLAYNFKTNCEKNDRKLREKVLDLAGSEDLTEIEVHDRSLLSIEEIKIESTVPDALTLDMETIIKDEQMIVEEVEDEEEADNDFNTEKSRNEKLKWACDLCPYRFEFVWHLGMHMKRKHKAIGEKCKECSIICYHPLHLQSHAATHTRYLCFLCGKKFNNEELYYDHLNGHNGIKAHKCKSCDKHYTTAKALKVHRDAAHLKLRPHKCNLCFKRFSQKTTLQTHVYSHTRFLNE